jgi:hypothetical protein
MSDASTICAQIDAARYARLINGVQKSVNWRDRSTIADALAGTTNALLARDTTPMRPELQSRADALQRDGVAYLGRLLSARQVADIHAYLKTKPCFPGHVTAYGDGVGRSVEECAKLANCGSYAPEHVTGAPHLLEVANSPDLLAIAESYLGCVPTIYSLNLFWSFSERDTRYEETQNYHRDFDDFRFCTVFLFMTDIQVDDGAHYFLRGTHRPDFVEKIYNERFKQPAPLPLERFFVPGTYQDADCPRLFEPETETVTGSPGEAVIEDTYGFHRGDIPKTNRLLGWIRYGLYRNASAYFDNRTGPVPAAAVAGRIPPTDRHKFINRLIVQPD